MHATHARRWISPLFPGVGDCKRRARPAGPTTAVAASADGDRPDGVLGLGLHWVVICTGAFGLGRKAGKGRLGKLPALSRPVFFADKGPGRGAAFARLASRLVSPAVLCLAAGLPARAPHAYVSGTEAFHFEILVRARPGPGLRAQLGSSAGSRSPTPRSPALSRSNQGTER